ncbi:hypothetical protein HX882_27050 [Pseudomonas gingeri]|uniref:Uncharacterized protein n=1 Tax=Pseudomonas gingeri TaxID=117681 RepID=A0A7Y7XH55_9PSED|nr:hypothetical protein [Pseudomonas gingeri]NWB99550.1 hypothetical protein [Pseudomonas gingeri]
MSTELTEEEMRLALFGPSIHVEQQALPEKSEPEPEPEPEAVPTPKPVPKARPVSKALSPKLRVTLHAAKVFGGEGEVFIYDANTLSTFVAEQEAKSAAKKKKFRYFDVVSIKPV